MSRWYLYPELASREVLLDYVRGGLTVLEIAERVGCSRTNVESALKNHGIKRRGGKKVRGL